MLILGIEKSTSSGFGFWNRIGLVGAKANVLKTFLILKIESLIEMPFFFFKIPALPATNKSTVIIWNVLYVAEVKPKITLRSATKNINYFIVQLRRLTTVHLFISVALLSVLVCSICLVIQYVIRYHKYNLAQAEDDEDYPYYSSGKLILWSLYFQVSILMEIN